jgi:hypothetical protein
MKKFRASLSQPSTKAPTGIVGLDEHWHDGRAGERITLLAGGPVCGKFYHESHRGIPHGLKLVPGAQEIRHFEHICS